MTVAKEDNAEDGGKSEAQQHCDDVKNNIDTITDEDFGLDVN
jgi:hypothetical protein